MERQKTAGIDTISNDWFGTSVSIGRDFAVVGAPNEGYTGPYNGSGAAYVLRRDRNGTPSDSSDDQWIPHAKLGASDSIVSGRFGTRVAITDELILVSAIRDSRGIVSSGAVYVFQHDDHDTAADPSDDSWAEVAKLFPLDVTPSDFFGWRGMAVHRDTAIVGAVGAGNSGGTQQDGPGAAYVFRRHDNGTPDLSTDDFWYQEAKILASNGARRDKFGTSVSISGHWAVVGAPNRGTGAAYVFRRDQGGTPSDPNDDVWTEHFTLSSPPNTGDLGQSVAINGNLLIVGASSEAAAYVYRRHHNNTPEDDSDDLWTQEARLFDDTVWSFGVEVAIHANVVAIGAHIPITLICDPIRCGTGKVFFYRQNGIDWVREGDVVSGHHPESTEDRFPSSISLDCDTAVVGASRDYDGGYFAGAAFFYTHDCVDCDEDCNANSIPDLNEFDSDGDGIIDECDGCPFDPEKSSPGLCGCGIAESDDSDGDGVCDSADQCPGFDDGVDFDGDGVPDGCDVCPGSMTPLTPTATVRRMPAMSVPASMTPSTPTVTVCRMVATSVGASMTPLTPTTTASSIATTSAPASTTPCSHRNARVLYRPRPRGDWSSWRYCC